MFNHVPSIHVDAGELTLTIFRLYAVSVRYPGEDEDVTGEEIKIMEVEK
jgi:hypothetical protein